MHAYSAHVQGIYVRGSHMHDYVTVMPHNSSSRVATVSPRSHQQAAKLSAYDI
jgi:hypothetical protein